MSPHPPSMIKYDEEQEAKNFWRETAIAMVRASVSNKRIDRRGAYADMEEVAKYADALTELYVDRFIEDDEDE